MLLRISLIIAVVAGLAAGALNFVTIQDKINSTQKQRDDFKKTADTETAAHKKSDKMYKETMATLVTTSNKLTETTGQLEEANKIAEQKTKEAVTLSESLKKTTEERDGAQNELAAWKALGLPIEKVTTTLAQLSKVSQERDAIAEENKILDKAKKKLEERIDAILNPEHEVKLPEGLMGKVLVTDPRYDFVVLNIGENSGVKEMGKLIVNRNGKLIAKVQIKSVSAERSIANVMPGWKLSDVLEGDVVLN